MVYFIAYYLRKPPKILTLDGEVKILKGENGLKNWIESLENTDTIVIEEGNKVQSFLFYLLTNELRFIGLIPK